MTTASTLSSPEETTDLTELDRLLARGIKVIRVVHADLFGRQRAKQFPISQLPQLLDGIAYSKMSVAEDLFGVPVDEQEFTQLAGHPDLHARLDASTAVVPPWEPDALWVIATLWEHGKRSALCARGQLEGAIDRMHTSYGLTSIAAAEPEFYLFERDPAGSSTQQPYSVEGVSYTIDRITDPRGSLGRMHRQLVDFGIGVTAVNREFSPGQFEINLMHGTALEAADRSFLLKTAVKELAAIEGLAANFMAKPLAGEEGSSLHMHLSLWRDGRNALDAGDSVGHTMRQIIGGLQHHAPALSAFTSPTVNSYKRLHGEGLSPDTANWGEDNRYTYLRIPAERGKATRVELRAGDAGANPHLLLAAMLHAAADGIERDLVPAPTGAPLPRTLGDALTALREDALFVEAFGQEFIDVYCAIKQREVDGYAVAVTDWEWKLYHSHI